MIRVKKIETDQELQQAFKVREVVFIDEQACPPEEEFDGFDDESIHFIAYISGEPVGTSRYRTTDKGVKLERFAVLKEHRGKGVGKRLVQTALGQIETTFESGTLLYLHAQLDAMPLYSRYGFQKVGEKFVEASIEHFLMKKVLS
ncbi:GNAT family N-acetyltransferase [Roseivirga sp. E12]|uniref:GNAT family N-acetyltransferase n=1 Tax=Roseivirga sp. E12 TaxID=2819237 RepID=UPI001ABCA69C|nr:GNAT family N-acetyltransferase [Roseivirga sp. E12]